MENLLMYLLKSSGLIVLFLIAYLFFLRKETFYNTNRYFLIAGLLLSAVLPVIRLKKTVWIETHAAAASQLDLNSLPDAVQNIVVQEPAFAINWGHVLATVYWMGVLFFIAKMVLEFYDLKHLLRRKTIIRQEDYKFVDLAENIAPFSFFNYIVYNSSRYTKLELDSIIEHEKVHCDQKHTYDILCSHAFCVIFWFNPFVWLYQKSIVQNLEFIADKGALKSIADKKAYQFTLLKITTHEPSFGLTNHFYQSLIKKRIFMLNKNESHQINSWKYGIVIPMLFFFIVTFQTQVIAQQKSEIPETSLVTVKTEMLITENSTTENLNAEKEPFKKDFNATLSFSDITRNEEGKILSIEVIIKGEGTSEHVYQVRGERPIQPFIVFAEKVGEEIIYGFRAPKTGNQHLKDHFSAMQKHSESGGVPKVVTINNTAESGTTTLNQDAKPLVIVNGKEVTDMDEIDPNQIKSIEVLKDEESIAVYGPKAKNGVILVTLEGQNTISATTANGKLNTTPVEAVVILEAYTSGSEIKNNENSGFTVHKKLDQDQLDFYQQRLEELGIEAKFSNIKRNKSGEIIGIKIKLSTAQEGSKDQAAANLQNSAGISDVYIGRKNGKLIIE